MERNILKTIYESILAKWKFLEYRGGSEDRTLAYASYGECGPELTTMRFEKFTFAVGVQHNP